MNVDNNDGMNGPQEGNSEATLNTLGKAIQERLLLLENTHPSSLTFPREISEEGVVMHYPTASNEPYLYKTFPYIREHVSTGAIVGVGIDQVLNFLVNSNAEEAHIVDITPHMTLTTRVALEAGFRFQQLFERMPTKREFVALFQAANLPATFMMLTSRGLSGYGLEPDELAQVEQHISNFERYLQYEAGQEKVNHNFWMSTDANLAKIIDMYAGQKIRLYRGNIIKGNVITSIAMDLHKRKMPLSLLYFSNAMYGEKEDILRNEFINTTLSEFDIHPNLLVVTSTPLPQPPYGNPPDEEQRGLTPIVRGKYWAHIIQGLDQFRLSPYALPKERTVYYELRIAM